jgi:hypothetical protein
MNIRLVKTSIPQYKTDPQLCTSVFFDYEREIKSVLMQTAMIRLPDSSRVPLRHLKVLENRLSFEAKMAQNLVSRHVQERGLTRMTITAWTVSTVERDRQQLEALFKLA